MLRASEERYYCYANHIHLQAYFIDVIEDILFVPPWRPYRFKDCCKSEMKGEEHKGQDRCAFNSSVLWNTAPEDVPDIEYFVYFVRNFWIIETSVFHGPCLVPAAPGDDWDGSFGCFSLNNFQQKRRGEQNFHENGFGLIAHDNGADKDYLKCTWHLAIIQEHLHIHVKVVFICLHLETLT